MRVRRSARRTRARLAGLSLLLPALLIPLTANVLPAAAAPTAAFVDDFGWATAGAAWQEGHPYGRWTDVYNGYGRVTRANDPVLGPDLSLTPATSSARSVTHSALVVSRISFGSMSASVAVRTLSQLRRGSRPNPWEVGWVLWHYRDPRHFYYLLLKPDGWELGKRDPAYPGGQRFLATGSVRFPVGRWHSVSIRQVGAAITVSADGHVLISRTDRQRPYLSGRLGLYTEDAHAAYTRIAVRPAG